MPTIIETEVFTIEELSATAKATAREWYRDTCFDDEWWDATHDDFCTVCDWLGITLRTRPVGLIGGGTRHQPCIWFRGFWNQGDGASFEGCYAHAKGSLARIEAHAPRDRWLCGIAQRLAAIQRRNFFALYATIDRGGFYCHEDTMRIDVRRGDAMPSADAGEVVDEALRDLARWLYAQLEAEYSYLTSDAVVDESIAANGYTFTVTGERFG